MHLKEQLRQGDKSLVGNKGYRRYLKVQGDHHFAIDEKQIKTEARYDGLWVLRTEYPLQCRDGRSRLQGTLDGRGHHPHHQIDYGHQAHLSQV